MNNIFVRLLVITLALVGVYKIFPQISEPVDYYIKNPSFQSGVVLPSVNLANRILPEKLQIPTPDVTDVMGVSTDYVGDSPLRSITDEITRQTASLAAYQIEQIRKTASDQFCSALLEKIKTECGL